MAGKNTRTFDESNFESDVLNADTPVLVDFWAEWCGPCLMLAPVIDDLADNYAGRVAVGKVDIDKSPQIAARFGVQNIPTVILFDKGEPAERVVGAKPRKEFESLLNARVSAAESER
jgi:thioredoxin 1